jgi:hypothetical protein
VAGTGDAFVTKTGVDIPADGAWHSVAFSVLPADFDQWGLTNDPAAALKNVSQLRIIHSPDQEWRGATGAATLIVDNIRAVPESSGAALALTAMILCCCRRKYASSACMRIS